MNKSSSCHFIIIECHFIIIKCNFIIIKLSVPPTCSPLPTLHGSTVELNWLPPLHPNGAICYEIEYEPARMPGAPVNARNSSSHYFTLTLPSDLLTYNVCVAALNTEGQTESIALVIIMCSGIETSICTYT